MKKIKLIAENNEINSSDYIKTSVFLNSEIEIDDELILGNPMIKGSIRTGKSTKVLIPMYKQWKYGKLFIDINYKNEDFIVNNETHYFDCKKSKVNYKEILNLLSKGEKIYLNINLENKANNIIINNIFSNIKTILKKLENPILICCDELKSLGKINNLTELLVLSKALNKNNKNVHIAFTNEYTRKLEGIYTEEEIQIIRDNVTMIDVEKQVEFI